MAELLQLSFSAPNAQELYNKVNGIIGFSPDSNAGYPDGLLSHIAGLSADGATLVVTEIWESQEAEAAFLADPLGPALAQAGAPEPTSFEWYTVLADNRGG